MEASYKQQKSHGRDPFYEEPLHKAFYHPSRNVHIETESVAAHNEDDRTHPLSPTSKRFLKSGNLFSFKSPPTGVSPGDTSSKFDESWPTSERPSTVDIPDYASPGSLPDKLDTDKGSLALLLKDKPWLAALIESDPVKSKLDFEMQPEKDESSGETKKESTLSKYIDRFRHGTPMSRNERSRKKTTNPRDFWWLQSPPPEGGAGTPADSSTPRDRDEPGKPVKRSKGSNTRAQKTRERYDDDDTELLQSKADMLLESASSLNSSDPIVSTVGLGSEADTTQDSASSFSEKPYRPEFIKKQIEKDPLTARRSKKPVNLEDDILAQWRMMRRRELAQSGLKPTTSGPVATVLQQSTKTASKLHASTGLDSKLDEFRGQLTRATHGVFEPIKAELTNQESEPRLTEVQPSANVTKQDQVVEMACQTSPPEASPPPEVPTAAPSEDSRPPGGDHVIASPALKYKLKATKGERTVEPHYHLSCDVIPWQPGCECCHGYHHSNGCDHGNHSNKPQKHGDKTRLVHKDTREEMSDFNSDYEIYKQKHMQRLEMELDRERVQKGRGQNQGQRDSRYERPERDKTRVHKGRDLESDTSDSESGVTLSMQDLKIAKRKAGQKVGQQGQKVGQENRRKVERQERSGSQSRDSVSETDSQVSSEKENVKDPKKTQKQSKPKHARASEKQKSDKTRTTGKTRGRDDVAPQRSESPNRRRERRREGVKGRRSEEETRNSRSGVGSAIGQVVTDRLFAGSPLSVRASVESNTSLPFPASPDPVPPGVEALLCSDEDEFIDDEILRDLRAKRNVYVRRLIVLEQLIQEKSVTS